MTGSFCSFTVHFKSIILFSFVFLFLVFDGSCLVFSLFIFYLFLSFYFESFQVSIYALVYVFSSFHVLFCLSCFPRRPFGTISKSDASYWVLKKIRFFFSKKQNAVRIFYLSHRPKKLEKKWKKSEQIMKM